MSEDDDIKWSIDIPLMGRHLRSEDELQSTIRAHLYVDHILIEILKLAMPGHSHVRLDRLPFLSKAEIAVGLLAIAPSELPPVKRLNIMRNHLAHNLVHTISISDKNKLFDSLPGIARDILKKDFPLVVDRNYRLSDIYITMIVLLEISRDNYRKIVERRQTALENARKVLANVKSYLDS